MVTGGKNTPQLLHQCTPRYIFGSFSHSPQSGYWVSCHCLLWIVAYNVSVCGAETRHGAERPGMYFFYFFKHVKLKTAQV